MRALLLLALLALAACGGRAQEAAAPEDPVLARLSGSAHRALELDEPESAARLYARALARARERDDAQAMADMAFGQATASLAHGDSEGALRVAREVRLDLERRGRVALPRLTLAEATALHRLGRIGEAEPLAREVAGQAAVDGAAALRAQFLLGLIAAGRGDLAGLGAARAGFQGVTEPAFLADGVELAAQEALLRGDARRAAAEAGAAAALRRDALDYRGLSRALALEGTARARLGQRAAAADLLRRAGQGAAQRGEQADSRRWLAEAARLQAPVQPAARPARAASQARRSARRSPSAARSR